MTVSILHVAQICVIRASYFTVQRVANMPGEEIRFLSFLFAQPEKGSDSSSPLPGQRSVQITDLAEVPVDQGTDSVVSESA